MFIPFCASAFSCKYRQINLIISLIIVSKIEELNRYYIATNHVMHDCYVKSLGKNFATLTQFSVL